MSGIKFGDVHSDTLGLKRVGPFTLSPPAVVTKYEKIPGRNGSIDSSESLTGYVVYDDREISMDFELETDSESEYMTKLSSVMNLIHGKRVPVIFDTDPDFKWDCRLSVSNVRSNQRYTKLTVAGTAFPYKRKVSDTVVQKDLAGTSLNIVCKNMAEPTMPIVETTADNVKIQFGSQSIVVNKGKHALGIVFTAGDNILTVTGTGTIKISYREGSL